MSNIPEIIENMRVQLSGISNREKTLAAALENAMRSGDEGLLQDVRRLTREHDVRRGTILTELENLGSRLGKFPSEQKKPVAGTEYAEASAKRPGVGHQPIGRADWRVAVSNIEDEQGDFYKTWAAPR